MTPELKRALHESVIRELRPEYLSAPYVIDWDTVVVQSWWDDPYSYSEYTGGGGYFDLRVSGEFIVGAAGESFGLFALSGTYSPNEMAGLFERVVG